MHLEDEVVEVEPEDAALEILCGLGDIIVNHRVNLIYD